MEKPARQACADAAFHVDFDEARDRWDVVDHDGRVVGHCHNQDEAIELAIREAQHGHSQGMMSLSASSSRMVIMPSLGLHKPP